MEFFFFFSSSLALHPDKNLVATAQIGKEPFVCVWDSTSLETVSILQGGHERGITALAFSNEGNVNLAIIAFLVLSVAVCGCTYYIVSSLAS